MYLLGAFCFGFCNRFRCFCCSELFLQCIWCKRIRDGCKNIRQQQRKTLSPAWQCLKSATKVGYYWGKKSGLNEPDHTLRYSEPLWAGKIKTKKISSPHHHDNNPVKKRVKLWLTAKDKALRSRPKDRPCTLPTTAAVWTEFNEPGQKRKSTPFLRQLAEKGTASKVRDSIMRAMTRNNL